MTPRANTLIRANFLRSACLLAGLAIAALPGLLYAGEKSESVEYETGFYYTVKKGDTLWSLSKKFSDNEWEWPEMWKDNAQIPNPHRIYPGERIRIFQKSRTEKMAVAEKPKAPVEKPKVKEPPFFYYSPIDRVGFLRKTPTPPNGSIFKVQYDKGMIGQGDLVYIRPNGQAPLTLGGRYTIYRTMAPYRDEKTKRIIGTQHYLTGMAEIKSIQAEYVTALVVKSYRDIKIGDELMPYQERSPKITLIPSPANVTGTILVAEEQEELIGTNFVAFIDKGLQDGIRPGQQYRIFDTEKITIEDGKASKSTTTKIDFATFLVLFAEPNTSTILVTQSKKNITPGDAFHSPAM